MSTDARNRSAIEYRNVPLAALKPTVGEAALNGREQVRHFDVDGDELRPTNRFWRSLFHRFGLAENVFRYFSHAEVFARVADRERDARLRLCVERHPDGRHKLLAVSNPKRPVLGFDDARAMLAKYADNGGTALSYHDGLLGSTHTPRSGEHGFDIGPDRFHNRFNVEVPIDGFGQPRIYLSLLRQICDNGAVGYARAFRSDVRVGADAAYTLERALGQFDHDEGFAALRQRFESGQKSWASLHEVRELSRVLNRLELHGSDASAGELQIRLDRLAGDLHALYGLANLDTLSAKRQRVLPARCRVYDLINFASEVATHHAPAQSRNRLQAYIGTLVSDEYDLEGTAERVPEFKDLFVSEN